LNTKGKLAPNWFYLLIAYMHQIRFRLQWALPRTSAEGAYSKSAKK